MKVIAIHLGGGIEDEQLQLLLALVSEGKRESLLRFRHEEDRLRSLTGELLIRWRIWTELGLPNDRIVLATNRYGKPELAAHPRFHFNISHAGEWTAAVFDRAPVGIDIERIAQIDTGTFASHFTKKEQSFVRASGSTAKERLERFYDIWTRKESYVKAIGTGLSMPLDSFCVMAGDAEHPASTLCIGPMENCCFHPLHIDAGYRLVVCSRTQPSGLAVEVLSMNKFVHQITACRPVPANRVNRGGAL